MSTNHTTNYQLSQWVKSDQVRMEDFNADNAKIDAAIKAVEQKANSLTTGKADASAVTALSQTVSAHTSSLSKKGNCQVYTTSYMGDGQCGSSHPNRLTFPGRPLLVLIASGSNSQFLALLPHGYGVNVGGNSYLTSISWGSYYVSWYNEQSAASQYNTANYTYHVVAFLAVD